MQKSIIPRILVLPVCGALCLAFVMCSNVKRYHSIEGPTQGTVYHITYQVSGNNNLTQDIQKLLHSFDLSLSTYNDSSIISKINNNIPVATDSLFDAVFNESKRIWELSSGYFDITIGPIANAYGFGSGKTMKINQNTIDSLLQFVGFEKVNLKDNELIKTDSRVQLNVNAIAQGFAVDVVCSYLESLNITNYLVEIGGEVRTKGVNASGELWKIGIDKPIEGNYIAGQDLQEIISISDAAVATSGNYRKFYESDGKKYVHTLNPKTGEPSRSNLLSATILHSKCITADALATACMSMGMEKSKILLEEHQIDAYLLYSDSAGNINIYATGKIKSMIDMP